MAGSACHLSNRKQVNVKPAGGNQILAWGAYSVKTDRRHSTSQVNTNNECLNTAVIFSITLCTVRLTALTQR